jgi:hypothetical protein
MLTPEEIEKVVYEKYPITDRERTCWQYMELMAYKREKLRQRLQDDSKAA